MTITRQQYMAEHQCATCQQPLANHATVRNINGDLVHRNCPKR